jgi:hypothetical protein
LTVHRAQSADESAIALANRLLAKAVLPADARAVSPSAVSELTAAVGPSCTPKIERSRFVVIPSSTPNSVRDFVVQHLAPGLALANVGVTSATSTGTRFIVSQSSDLGDQLYFTIAPAADGAVHIRLDAVVIEPQGVCTFNAVHGLPSPSPHSIAASQLASSMKMARARARQMLDAAILPSGSRTVSAIPGPAFKTAATYTSCAPQIDLSRLVVIKGHTLAGLKAFLVRHPTDGLAFMGSGMISSDRTREVFVRNVEQGDGRGTQLVFSMVRTTGGAIGVRISAIVVPVYANCQSTGVEGHITS